MAVCSPKLPAIVGLRVSSKALWNPARKGHDGESFMTAQHPRAPTPIVDLSLSIGRSLSEFLSRQAEWAEHTTQDAIESVVRIPWRVQVRRGVRVPVAVLYGKAGRRLATAEVHQFLQRSGPAVAAHLGLSPGTVHQLGLVVLRSADLPPPPANPVLRRGWREREVAWRLRFEHDLRAWIERREARPLTDWLETTLQAVVTSWSHAARSGLELPEAVQ